jgi:hypothetical protein
MLFLGLYGLASFRNLLRLSGVIGLPLIPCQSLLKRNLLFLAIDNDGVERVIFVLLVLSVVFSLGLFRLTFRG